MRLKNLVRKHNMNPHGPHGHFGQTPGGPLRQQHGPAYSGGGLAGPKSPPAHPSSGFIAPGQRIPGKQNMGGLSAPKYKAPAPPKPAPLHFGGQTHRGNPMSSIPTSASHGLPKPLTPKETHQMVTNLRQAGFHPQPKAPLLHRVHAPLAPTATYKPGVAGKPGTMKVPKTPKAVPEPHDMHPAPLPEPKPPKLHPKLSQQIVGRTLARPAEAMNPKKPIGTGHAMFTTRPGIYTRYELGRGHNVAHMGRDVEEIKSGVKQRQAEAQHRAAQAEQQAKHQGIIGRALGEQGGSGKLSVPGGTKGGGLGKPQHSAQFTTTAQHRADVGARQATAQRHATALRHVAPATSQGQAAVTQLRSKLPAPSRLGRALQHVQPLLQHAQRIINPESALGAAGVKLRRQQIAEQARQRAESAQRATELRRQVTARQMAQRNAQAEQAGSRVEQRIMSKIPKGYKDQELPQKQWTVSHGANHTTEHKVFLRHDSNGNAVGFTHTSREIWNGNIKRTAQYHPAAKTDAEYAAQVKRVGFGVRAKSPASPPPPKAPQSVKFPSAPKQSQRAPSRQRGTRVFRAVSLHPSLSLPFTSRSGSQQRNLPFAPRATRRPPNVRGNVGLPKLGLLGRALDRRGGDLPDRYRTIGKPKYKH